MLMVVDVVVCRTGFFSPLFHFEASSSAGERRTGSLSQQNTRPPLRRLLRTCQPWSITASQEDNTFAKINKNCSFSLSTHSLAYSSFLLCKCQHTTAVVEVFLFFFFLYCKYLGTCLNQFTLTKPKPELPWLLLKQNTYVNV